MPSIFAPENTRLRSSRPAVILSGRNKARWGHLFQQHHADLRGFFHRRRVGTDDVDDLVQEVYARLLRATGDEGTQVLDPGAYLFTVAANLSREHMQRWQSQSARVGGIDDYEHVLTDGEHPEVLMQAEQRRRQVQQVLAQLPDRTRDVLVLQHRDGLSYQQIAERLGISIHAVKKHVTRGMLKCRQAASRKEDA